jgi:D-xylose transport system permease protein
MLSQTQIPAASPPAATGGSWRRVLASDSVRDSTLWLVIACVWVFFYFFTEGSFLTPRNLVLLALQTSIVSLAAISAVMLIITRNFDLSIGSAVALVGVIVATLTVRVGMNAFSAVLVALAAGLAMGAWQGWWVTRMGVSSFIVTLAGMMYFRGISMIATNGSTVAPVPESLTALATGFVSPTLSVVLIAAGALGLAALRWSGERRARALGVAADPSSLATLKWLLPGAAGTLAAWWAVSWQGIPYLVLLVAVCAFVADVTMRHTTFGVQLHAVGGNPEAARLSGIPRQKVIFRNFLVAGLAYGITGIALTARVSGAVAGSAGLFLELDAIAAAIIGGTSLSGGKGRVFGALAGALLMGSLNNGMSLMNVPTFYQDTARGAVLLLAVAIDQLSRRRGARSKSA